MHDRMKTIVLLPIACLLIPPCGELSADDWPQWLGPERNGIWRESGVIDKFDTPQIECRWRVPISSGFSGPTVASSRVFVSDAVTEPEQKERVHCFDAVTGKTIWSHSYSCDYGPISFRAGPRASVTIDAGRAYALGAVGHFHCFDAASGGVLWKKDLVGEYGIDLLPWGIATSPLVEQGLVILQIGAGDDRCVVAFDKETGQERWTALDDPTSYASPVVVDQAGHRVLVCWTGAGVVGLDPITGTVYWKHLFAHPKGWIDAICFSID